MENLINIIISDFEEKKEMTIVAGGFLFNTKDDNLSFDIEEIKKWLKSALKKSFELGISEPKIQLSYDNEMYQLGKKDGEKEAIKVIGEAVSDYFQTEGCSCCSDGISHKKNRLFLKNLLNLE